MNPLARIKFEKREDVGLLGRVLAIGFALIASMLVSALINHFADASPSEAFINLIKGAFGSRRAILETLVKSTPLILTGLATVIAFRGKIWSIGQEGQFFLGAIGGYWAYRIFGGLPTVALIPIIILAGFIIGGGCGMGGGFLEEFFYLEEI